MAPDQLLALRARRAYEVSRLGVGARMAIPAALVVLLALAINGPDPMCLAAGGLLCAIVAASGWQGGEWGRAALPALAAGLLPFFAPLSSRGLGHVCVAGSCVSYCLIACAVSGFVAGFLFTSRARPQGGGWLLGAAVLALTGSLGCAFTGLPGMIGMLVGGAAGVVPAALWMARSPSSSP